MRKKSLSKPRVKRPPGPLAASCSDVCRLSGVSLCPVNRSGLNRIQEAHGYLQGYNRMVNSMKSRRKHLAKALSDNCLMEAGFQCAGCGEWNSITVDESAGRRQSYIEDCQTCCKPNLLQVEYDTASREYFIAAALEWVGRLRMFLAAVASVVGDVASCVSDDSLIRSLRYCVWRHSRYS